MPSLWPRGVICVKVSLAAVKWHRSAAMVRQYIRDGSMFQENAAAKVGL